MPLCDLGPDVRARFGLVAGTPVVVGVSGGVDSTVLLQLLHAEGFSVVAAHVNYGLRGAESDADEVFVQALADSLGVPCHVRRVALEEKKNRQARAREARYGFFAEIAAEVGAEAVAVGHTQDDQAETVLLHLFRGTGPRGLAGMPAVRRLAPGSSVPLIRPLLSVSRAEIEARARAEGWAWREDASNASLAYRRNALRNRVLPLVRRHFGADVSARIAGTADLVHHLVSECQGETPGVLSLDTLRALSPSARHTRYHTALAAVAPLAPRRPDALAALDALLDAQPGRRVEWPGVVVWRDREALVFEAAGAEEGAPTEGQPVASGRRVEVGEGVLTVEPLARVPEDPASSDPNVEVADADALNGLLVLRAWRAGDRLRPLGFDGTKRVSDLLTERRVPPQDRIRALVLLSGDEIVWVVGHRLAHAARVRPETRRAVRLAWTPAGAAGNGAAPSPC